MTTRPAAGRQPGFNPYRRFALLALLGALLITFVLLYSFRAWDGFFAWLIAVNIVAFAAFGYDKMVAPGGGMRIPEVILLALTAMGGAAGAVLARLVFRHKTQKLSFRLAFWPCVGVAIALVAIYYLVICPGCR